MTQFIEGFTELLVTKSRGEIRVRYGGSGFPMLLLLGHLCGTCPAWGAELPAQITRGRFRKGEGGGTT
jgi:hypothetical protein